MPDRDPAEAKDDSTTATAPETAPGTAHEGEVVPDRPPEVRGERPQASRAEAEFPRTDGAA